MTTTTPFIDDMYELVKQDVGVLTMSFGAYEELVEEIKRVDERYVPREYPDLEGMSTSSLWGCPIFLTRT